MSLIQWTDETWNPTTGCNRVSRECTFCYAEKLSVQYQKRSVPGYGRGFDFNLQPQRLGKPKEIAGAKYIFAGSMSDLFHERCPDDYILDVFDVMNEADQHVYQCLTKRPERIVEMEPHLPWGKNIWAGTSVGRPEAKDRIDLLRETNADVKWISAEPLVNDLGDLDLTGIDWVVMGGESGPKDKIKELDLQWIQDIIQQCRDQGVTPFVKQLGEIWAMKDEQAEHSHGGDIFEWPAELQVREVPEIYPGQPELDTLPGIVGL